MSALLASRAMRRVLAALALVAVAVALGGCAVLGGDDVSVVPPDERTPRAGLPRGLASTGRASWRSPTTRARPWC